MISGKQHIQFYQQKRDTTWNYHQEPLGFDQPHPRILGVQPRVCEIMQLPSGTQPWLAGKSRKFIDDFPSKPSFVMDVWSPRWISWAVVFPYSEVVKSKRPGQTLLENPLTINRGFPIAMFDYQRVIDKSRIGMHILWQFNTALKNHHCFQINHRTR